MWIIARARYALLIAARARLKLARTNTTQMPDFTLTPVSVAIVAATFVENA
jgi:hypothetical protein